MYYIFISENDNMFKFIDGNKISSEYWEEMETQIKNKFNLN